MRRMRLGTSALVFALLTSAALAGCSDNDGPGTTQVGDGTPEILAPVEERHLQEFAVDGFYSFTLADGPFGILDGLRVDVPVDLPITEGGNAVTGDARTNLGLFLPKIPGCDWTAKSLPDECHIPVIADAGPYYAASLGVPDLQTEGDSVSTEPAHRLGGFLIDNFVPYGYAVAQVSVFGTGDSNHCMDLMGDAEQAGLDAAITWLGTQPWSNGRVAMTGRSYDGSTPWEAAMFGNPHLASIVPISGLTSQFDLMYHNGSAESRGAGL
ncbi:MAG: X-Pro dipeptidyl-peptidase, partial [Thermoplasmata archaeon]|nr:X-Pro dipeptidyl-peptidase [Thermoplasmata archaeon]